MNITCGQCGKRYKMKAEQSKKAFKTRCKRCSNIIIVRPDELAAQAQQQSTPQADPRVHSQAQAQAPAHSQSRHTQGQAQVAHTSGEKQWYAVVNGEQGGPYSTSQLISYYQGGSLDAQSYVWCDGMPNWEALQQVPELQALISQATSAQAHPQQVQPPVSQVEDPRSMPQEQQQDQGREVLKTTQVPSSQHQDEEVLTSTNAYAASQNAIAKSSTPQQDRASADLGQLTNQRNENSVLFSLDSIGVDGGIQIHNSLPMNKPVAASPALVTNTGGSEGSGLIDISSLGSLTGGVADGNGSTAPINIAVGATRSGRRVSMTSSRTDYKTVALIVISIALIAVSSIFAYQKWIAPPQTIPTLTAVNATNQSAISTTQRTPKRAVNAIQAQASAVTVSSSSNSASSASTEKTADPAPALPVKVSTSTASPKRLPKPRSKSRKSKRSRTRRAKTPSSTAQSSRRKAPKKTKSSPSKSRGKEAASLLAGIRRGKTSSRSSLPLGRAPAKSGPKRPPKKSIISAMRRVNLNKCLTRDPSLKGRGSIKVKIVAISSGAITTARVQNSPYKSSPVGACLEREVKRQRFPNFTDPRISFTFPFKN